MVSREECERIINDKQSSALCDLLARAHLELLTKMQANSCTWGDLIKRLGSIPTWIESHEWDNLNPSEQRDKLLDELRGQRAALESEVKKEQRRIGAIFLEREELKAERAAIESQLAQATESYRELEPCGHAKNFLIGDEHGHFTCTVCRMDKAESQLADTKRDLAEGNRQNQKIMAAWKEAQDQLAEAQKALVLLLHYREHSKGCEIGQTDFCNCGMAIAAGKAKEAIDAAGALRAKPEATDSRS